jgi:hypothetical protein
MAQVTECDIDKLEPVPEVPPSSSLIQLSAQLLNVFQLFTQALMDEEKADKLAREQKKKRELEKKEAKEKRERDKKEREKEKAKQKAKETALSSEWSCPTYVPQPSLWWLSVSFDLIALLFAGGC